MFPYCSSEPENSTPSPDFHAKMFLIWQDEALSRLSWAEEFQRLTNSLSSSLIYIIYKNFKLSVAAR
jgi:hypothetical protein